MVTLASPLPRPDLAILRRVWALAMAALIAVSWRLWVPRTEDSLAGDTTIVFPAIPLLGLPPGLAWLIDAMAFVCVVSCLVAIAVRPQIGPWSTLLLGIGLMALFITNQHRLQPWAYQAWLYCWAFTAWSTGLPARRALLAITSSIYAYSALGKFDQQFLHTVGPGFVSVWLPWWEPPAGDRSLGLVTWAVLALPAIELTIAGSLLVPRLRRAAGVAAITMHTVLLLTLGPLGMNQSRGVIVWNLYLAFQAWWLFVRDKDGQGPAADAPLGPVLGKTGTPPLLGSLLSLPALAVIGLALVLPCGERFPRGKSYGYWDHWLSWSLYSPHTSRAELQIHRTAIASLPPIATRFARATSDDDGWVTLQIGQWSLAELGVPIYPQARFQLGVAQRIGARVPSQAMRVRVRTTSDRFTGQREEILLLGQRELAEHVRKYWFLPSVNNSAASRPAGSARKLGRELRR